MKKQLLLIVFTGIVSSGLFGQNIKVNTGATPAQLVATLVDPSIAVSNITINCPATACGTFTNNGSNLGIPSGVVLTTGYAKTAGANIGVEGKNTDPCQPPFLGSNASASFNYGTSTADADLSGLLKTAATLYDLCKLEFDFTTAVDSIEIYYVFGSEEYEGFSPPTDNSGSFNDVFGFFVNGPGLAGKVDFAIVSGTTLPGTKINAINCNNINPAINSGFYINNCTAPGATSIQYNGFTKLMRGAIGITAGQTYHIKMAITDVGDGNYDLGIFIKANSIKPPPSVLPVNLVYFTAQLDNARQRNILRWQTAQEKNSTHFEVLRRTDDNAFGVITSINGNGNSMGTNNYEYIDEQPADGVNYYMLRQVDFNGKATFSNVVSLANRTSIKIKDVFPNPVTGNGFTAVIDMPADAADAKAEILDIVGRVIISQPVILQAGTNEITVNTENLQTGTYFFRIVDGINTCTLQRIVK